MWRRASPDSYLYPYIRTCPFIHLYANANSYCASYTYSYPPTHARRYGDTCTSPYVYAHAYAHAYAYPYPYGDAGAYSYAYR